MVSGPSLVRLWPCPSHAQWHKATLWHQDQRLGASSGTKASARVADHSSSFLARETRAATLGFYEELSTNGHSLD